MITKLAVLALLVAAAVGLGRVMDARNTLIAGSEAAAIALLPQALPGYRLQHSWNNPIGGGYGLEQGALYAPVAAPGEGAGPPAGDAVLLDFLRNSRRVHNGALCYLLQGETLRSESLHTVNLAGGTAVFNVVIMAAEDYLRLAASTECSARACSETRMPIGTAPWRQSNLRELFGAEGRAVVPLAVIIKRVRTAESEASAESSLFDEFTQVAGRLDLAPAQHLAAALDSAGAR